MPIADSFRLAWTPFLKKIGGKMHQAVALVCPTVLGSGGEFILEMGGRRRRAQTLDLIRYTSEIRDQNTPIEYLWMVPRPARPARVRATWKPLLGGEYRASLVLRPAQPMTVYATFKTHLDIGYTHRIEEVIRLYQTQFMQRLLENLDATADRPPGRRFVWTLSTWLLERCLDPAAVHPEHLKRLEKYIRDGTVVWGLMPFTTHSEFFGLEEMCRSIYAARRLAERFNRPVPTAAKMTDVPAHTASLAMAFAAAGGRFFQIGTNPESVPPDVPPLFWWHLPDGQRLLCHYRGTYGTPLLPPEDWPWRSWLAIQITNDNVGPQSLWTLDRMDWIGKHFDSPVCRTGRLEDFADAIIREHGNDLPIVEKEFTDWWIHGIASMADRTKTARIDKERLPTVEMLRTAAGMITGSGLDQNETMAQHAGRVREAYEQLALYTEHTWGDHATDARQLLPQGNRYTSDLFAGGEPRPPVDRWVASWRDKAAFADRAHELTDELEAVAKDAFLSAFDVRRETLDVKRSPESGTTVGSSRLTSHVSLRTSHRDGCAGIALFNPLNWARGGIVSVPACELPKGEFELVDPTTGGAVLYERDGEEIVFAAPPVPACGYLVLEVRASTGRSRAGLAADWHERMLALHTDDYTLQFHEAGGLARWHDRARSSQWCCAEVEFPMGTYLYEMPGGDQLRRFARKVHSNSYAETEGYFQRHEYADMPHVGPVGGGAARVQHEITPLFARVVVEADCPQRKAPHRRSGDAQRYRSTFTVYHGRRDLHVRVELLGKRSTYAAEAGYAFFPFSGDEPFILINRIAHQLNPARELAGRVNAAHMAVGRGVRIEHEHAGINFYPLHTPLVSFGQPGVYRFDENGAHESGILYATLFNNGWGTNFAQWQPFDDPHAQEPRASARAALRTKGPPPRVAGSAAPTRDYAFDFVLRPTGNDDWDGGLERGGAEVFRPLVAMVLHDAAAAPRGGRVLAEPAASLLSIEPSPYVQLVTLKPAEFEPGLVIRLWNADANPVHATIGLPAWRRAGALWQCDLVERRKRRIPVNRDGSAKLALRPNEIATLLLQGR